MSYICALSGLAQLSDNVYRDWDRIASPAKELIVPYDSLPKVDSSKSLHKLAVLKVNGGLGTSMGEP